MRGIDPVILARFRAFLQKKYGKVHGLQGQFISEALKEWLDKRNGVVVETVDVFPRFPVGKVKISGRTKQNIDHIRRLLISELQLTPELVPEYIPQVILTNIVFTVIADYRYRRRYIGLLEELGYIEGAVRDGGVHVYKLKREWLFPGKPTEEAEVVV